MSKKERNNGSTPDLATKKGLKIKVLSPLNNKTRPQRRPNPQKVLHAEFKKIKSQQMQSIITPYKTAQLYTGKSYWYIYYYYINPLTGRFERLKEYFDINRIANKKERRLYGQEAVKFVNQKLTMGFNPFKQVAVQQQGGTIINKLDQIYNDLMTHANDGMKKYYSTQLNRFKNFLKEKKLENIAVGNVNAELAENFKSWMQENKLSKKTINVNLSHMSIFWNRAIKLNLAAADPFAPVERVKKDIRHESDEKDDVFEPLTFEEMKRINAAIKQCETPNFLTAIMMIYYAWIRPKEVRQLRVGDINLESQFIKLKKGNTKSDKGAFVQIVPPLLILLQSMELHRCQASDYLFSENYIPGKKPLFRLKMSRLWNGIVKRQLNIDKNMYALKHTGNIEYLLNNKGNADLKWQQMQNRHSSAAMTEKYNRQLGAYFIDVEKMKFREL